MSAEDVGGVFADFLTDTFDCFVQFGSDGVARLVEAYHLFRKSGSVEQARAVAGEGRVQSERTRHGYAGGDWHASDHAVSLPPPPDWNRNSVYSPFPQGPKRARRVK